MMNDKIFQLIQEINGRVGSRWLEEDKAELAELVVMECMMLVGDYVDHRIPASEYRGLLQQHFDIPS